MQLADVLGTIDDLQMPVVIDEARVSGLEIAILEGISGGLGIIQVALEQPRAPKQHLAVFGNFQIHPGHGCPTGIRAYLSAPLDGDVHGGLGHTVDLFQVDAQGAKEVEDLWPDRLTARMGDADAAEAQVILERSVHQNLADPVQHFA